MTWDAMVTEEQAMNQVRADHGQAAARTLTALHRKMSTLGGFVMLDRGFLQGWWAGIAWVLHMQNHEYDNLTATEAITELRKGEGSIYWPIKKDDPRLWVDCPEGHRTLVGVEAICDEHGIEVI